MNSRLRGLLIIGLAVIVAIMASYMISNMLESAQQRVVAQRPVDREAIVVAAHDIPPGWTITANDLRERNLPVVEIPDDVFRTAEEVVGRVASERLLSGEYLREERLAAPEAGVGLPAIIPRGMRALQVPLRNSAAVSGFVNPGNFVDVLAVCTQAEPPEVRTLLQAVSVLAVNERMVSLDYNQRSGGSADTTGAVPSVTLALSPSDAELVKHAFGTCSILLTLRNDIDVTQIESNEPTASGGDALPDDAQGRLEQDPLLHLHGFQG